MKETIAKVLVMLIALLLPVTAGFSQEDSESESQNETMDPEVTDEELQEYAEVYADVQMQLIASDEQRGEILEGSDLSSSELHRLETALDAAGGDLENVDEAYTENEEYRDVLRELADLRGNASDAIDNAVEESSLERRRFDELIILISHDRQLQAEANELIESEMESDGENSEDASSEEEESSEE